MTDHPREAVAHRDCCSQKPAEGAVTAHEAFCHPVTGMCPQCLRSIPGEVVSQSDGVFMRTTCPTHGRFDCIISSDLEAYERMRRSPRLVKLPPHTAMPEAKGCPDDCGLCPAHDQHTCLAIVEITSRCNLPCPVCLADSNAKGSDLSPAQVALALERLLVLEGAPVPLQFAGGEPTLHSELVRIVREARALGFGKMEVDSNGLLLAKRPELAGELKSAGLTGIYLQMDGLDAAEHAFMRGRDLMAEKLRAIENCRQAGLQIVLSVTVVPGVNDHRLWDIVEFALAQRLTGVNFQSIALSGRYPDSISGTGPRFTAGHFMRRMEAQSGGQLRADDLMPMSCPDPRCGLLAYVIVTREGELLPLTRLVDEQRLLQHVADFTDWEPLLRQIGCNSSGCGCDGESPSLDRLVDSLNGAECFSIGFHGMMDAYCFDMERARRCCVHKLTAEGKLMPFCLYNMKYRQDDRQPGNAIDGAEPIVCKGTPGCLS